MSDKFQWADFFNPDFIMEMNIILCVLHKQFRFLNLFLSVCVSGLF